MKEHYTHEKPGRAPTTRKQIIVRGESFFLEPLSPSVVRVEHRDQVGWFGISRNWDVDNPFAFQTWELESYDDGVGNSMTETSTPESALNSLIHWLLHEYLEGLPDSVEP